MNCAIVLDHQDLFHSLARFEQRMKYKPKPSSSSESGVVQFGVVQLNQRTPNSPTPNAVLVAAPSPGLECLLRRVSGPASVAKLRRSYDVVQPTSSFEGGSPGGDGLPGCDGSGCPSRGPAEDDCAADGFGARRAPRPGVTGPGAQRGPARDAGSSDSVSG